MPTPGTLYSLEVRPRIPERLQRLEELANDLLYSWDDEVRGLFERLDPPLWEECVHNPKLFLRRVAQSRLQAAAEDRVFLVDFNRVLSFYDTYMAEKPQQAVTRHLDPNRDLVAYFCAEFGLHESLPIYSGGLGILAGDHCKAASDLGLPFVAVGLLYRQGYFTQRIDKEGRQIASYTPSHFGELPIRPALDAAGEAVTVSVALPGREVTLRVWRVKAGHIDLYLLDSDLERNREADRAITYQLYGGDLETRIQQEMVLGIGGVRALRALGLSPTVWHINEGHAAFQVLERAREHVAAGMAFEAALELVAAGTVFTTHTPVPAGHDAFSNEQMESYFGRFAEELHIPFDRFIALGAAPGNAGHFNQTALALRGSRFHNGVSRIHGDVAAEMAAYVWPEVPHKENPLTYVTNGVHVPTFLALEWMNLFDLRFGAEWRNRLTDEAYWQRVHEIPDHSFWSVRKSLKAELLEEVRRRIELQCKRNGASRALLEALTRHLTGHASDILTIGFARRFATYKRATLIFSDLERLARLVNEADRPILLLFAGKAHPSDQPGQELIRKVHEISRRPEFIGRLLLLEDYNLALARKLVAGVDVWLNNPEYPLEASGTSGQKAGINGVVNLSVLDGWWGEGYVNDGGAANGWAIAPHGPEFEPGYRDREEGHDLLDTLENEVVPAYYRRSGQGYSKEWLALSKASMRTILPRFNAQRMVMDYVADLYAPANRRRRQLLGEGEHDAAGARELAAWKARVRDAWPKIRLRRIDEERTSVLDGEPVVVRVAVELDGLEPHDVVLGCLIGRQGADGDFIYRDCRPMAPTGETENGEVIFELKLNTHLPGMQYYKLRLYPHHELMAHRFELGRMAWL